MNKKPIESSPRESGESLKATIRLYYNLLLARGWFIRLLRHTMLPSKRAWPKGSLVLTHYVSLCKKCLYGLLLAFCPKLPTFSTPCIIVKNNWSMHLTIIDTSCDTLHQVLDRKAFQVLIVYLKAVDTYIKKSLKLSVQLQKLCWFAVIDHKNPSIWPLLDNG